MLSPYESCAERRLDRLAWNNWFVVSRYPFQWVFSAFSLQSDINRTNCDTRRNWFRFDAAMHSSFFNRKIAIASSATSTWTEYLLDSRSIASASAARAHARKEIIIIKTRITSIDNSNIKLNYKLIGILLHLNWFSRIKIHIFLARLLHLCA